MNALGITHPTPRAPVDAAGTRNAGADAPDATGTAFVALLGALKGTAAPEDKPAEPDGPPAEDEAHGSTPGATAEPAKQLDLLAAFNAALPLGTGPAPMPARDALDVLVARAMPAAVPNPDPHIALAALASAPPQAAGPVDPADLAILPGNGADDVPVQAGASAPAPEARTRATILRRETHFAPVLPRLLAGSSATVSVGRPAPLGPPLAAVDASPDAGVLPTLAPMAAAPPGPAAVPAPTAPAPGVSAPQIANVVPPSGEKALTPAQSAGVPPADESPRVGPAVPAPASQAAGAPRPVIAMSAPQTTAPPTTAPLQSVRGTSPILSEVGLGAPIPAPVAPDPVPDLPNGSPLAAASPGHEPADPRAPVLPLAVTQAEADAAPLPGFGEEDLRSAIRQPAAAPPAVAPADRMPASDAPVVQVPPPATAPPADAPARPVRLSGEAPMPDADPAPRSLDTSVAAGPVPDPEASSPALPRPAPIANAAPVPVLPAGKTAGVAASAVAPSQPDSAEPSVPDAPAPGLGAMTSSDQAVRVSQRPIPEGAPAPVDLGSPTGQNPAPPQEPASGQDLPIRQEPALPSTVVPSIPRAPAPPLQPGERVDPAMRQAPALSAAGPSAATAQDAATPRPALTADLGVAAIEAEPPAHMPPGREAQAALIRPRAESVATPSVATPVAATLGGPPLAALPSDAARDLPPQPNPAREAATLPAGPPVDPTRGAVSVEDQTPGPAGPQAGPVQPAARAETQGLPPESVARDGVARTESAMPASPPSPRDSEAGPQRAEARRSHGSETPPLGEPASPGPSATGPGGQPAVGASSAPLMGQVLAGAPAQAASAPPAQQVAAAILGQMPRASFGAVPGASGIEGPLRLLTLQLHPADLGIVLVRMRLRDGQIEMNLHAAREETATLLREGGEVLADLLRQGGYQPERVTISGGSSPNGPAPGEGQAFQTQADAGANPDHATPGQSDRRQPDGRVAAPETSERNHESVPSSPDRSGVYL